ncbi:hypothetical protein [Eubacterium sp. 1001713B170207_170306_E7]|uniref:hypothetical protein n=1 Tax=Eubacterium sp. 1001713B170207_170306_E7 TaxID=2787097 RepID=UPI001899DF1C|nr:hypothetical protein [Eubacterium sp. 1001713B170207_170306_E7]
MLRSFIKIQLPKKRSIIVATTNLGMEQALIVNYCSGYFILPEQLKHMNYFKVKFLNR